MTEISATELALSVRFNRPIQNGPLTLFAVMRNEIYILPAFLAHYRALGIEQFVIVDDASDDGTSEYLAAQPDCSSGMSPIRFGMHVTISDPSHTGLSGRAGPIFKRVVPDHYLRGQHVLIADADEFLLLPPSLPRVPDVVALMQQRGWKSVAASLIDFYPETLEELGDPAAPADVSELFTRFGFFDAVPFITLTPGQQPAKTGETASERLFRLCGIRNVPPAFSFLPRWLNARLPWGVPSAAWFKTPIILYDGATFMVASHAANVPPPPEIMLAMAHFKFTGDTYAKIQTAIRLKAHARKGQKYAHYEEMLRVMEQRRLGFHGPHSARYTAPSQLIAAGLMTLPEQGPGGAET
ncbi:glycosyltransferase family 2 protein [Aestuariivirga sp.]|uniref:glycosyltransferase family 2 protein n=1 Tax=Aestuariivirga sp. TaxID=2650926 RepID=UPI003BAB84B3